MLELKFPVFHHSTDCFKPCVIQISYRPQKQIQAAFLLSKPLGCICNLELNSLCGRLLLLPGNLPERRTDGLRHWITCTQVKTRLTTATRCKLSKQINLKKPRLERNHSLQPWKDYFSTQACVLCLLQGMTHFGEWGKTSEYLNTSNLSQCTSLHETRSGCHCRTKGHKKNSSWLK